MERLRQVLESYERIAESYRKSRSRPWIKTLLCSLSQALPERPGRIVDVGCGASMNAVYVSSLAKTQYVGVDFSYQMLKILRDELCSQNLSADLICADARALPLRDHISDMTTLIASIHNVPLRYNRAKVLAEAVRVTRRDGIVLATCWSREVLELLPSAKPVTDEPHSYLVKWSWNVSEPVYRYYHFYDIQELLEDLETVRTRIAGFKIQVLGLFRKSRFTNIIVLLRRE